MKGHFILAGLLLAAPVAASEWYVGNMREPDTALDRQGGLMFPDPDHTVGGQAQLYFNAYAVQASPNSTILGANRIGPAVNPNLLTGGQVGPGASVEFAALLGAWRDCNKDGFMGYGAGGLLLYPPDLLDADSPCQGDGRFVRPGFVWEYVPLYPRKGSTGSSPTHGIPDPEVRVWGDKGRPGEVDTFACRQLPAPHGAFRSTGGILQYVDCQASFPVAEAQTMADPDDETGLRFEDPYHPEADCHHPLNRDLVWHNPHCERGTNLWEEGEDDPAFTVFDCSQPRGTLGVTIHIPGGVDDVMDIVEDPTSPIEMAAQVSHVTVEVATVDPRPGNLFGGSYYDSANNTWNGVRGCKDSTPRATQMDGPNAQYLNLERGRPTDPALDAKRVNDFVLLYHPGGQGPFFPTNDPFRPVLGNYTQSMGVLVLDDLRSSGWRTMKPTTFPAYRGHTLTDQAEIQGPLWFTFYARVSEGTLATHLLPGQEKRYGAEVCSGRSDIHRGWDCDAEHWWNPDHGAVPEPGSPGFPNRAARPGDPYHLRDVDCYDGAITRLVPLVTPADLSAQGRC